MSMERLTDKTITKACNDTWDLCGLGAVCKRDCHNPTPCKIPSVVYRLAQIEDILGDTYDLDRLRELIAADRAGKVMILPVKPGEYVYLITLGREIVRLRVGNVAAEEWGTSFEGYVEGFGPYRTGPNEKVFFSQMDAVNALKREVLTHEHQ